VSETPQPTPLTTTNYAVPVMDASAAQAAGQLPPDMDENFYTFAMSAARQEEVPQMPPSEANGATLIRQQYDKEQQA
jgi:hypothetical protein